MSSSAIPIDSNSLLAFPPEFDFIPMIKQINSNFKSSSTSDILSAINSLLLLLKFEQTLFTLSMDNVFDYFIKHLQSENTSIMENCLLLICEMYSTYKKEMQFKDWLRTLIKKLLKLSTLPIESISKLANLALNNIIKNYNTFICFLQVQKRNIDAAKVILQNSLIFPLIKIFSKRPANRASGKSPLCQAIFLKAVN